MSNPNAEWLRKFAGYIADAISPLERQRLEHCADLIEVKPAPLIELNEDQRWIASLMTHMEDNWRAIDEKPIKLAREYLLRVFPHVTIATIPVVIMEDPKGPPDELTFSNSKGQVVKVIGLRAEPPALGGCRNWKPKHGVGPYCGNCGFHENEHADLSPSG